MNTNPALQQSIPPSSYPDEQILVVKRPVVIPAEGWHGIQALEESVVHRILAHGEFQPRALMEEDPQYKQIIPYLIFTHDKRVFLMQRKSKASETRLQGKFTLGIGGHIRQEDITGTDVVGWAQREFHEEVAYEGTLSVSTLGLLNDDTNAVGQVHIGLVYRIEGSSPLICVKEELAWGELITLEECRTFYDRMESWSQVVFDHLCQATL